ncbi:MAG: response regulator [Ferruginibacter sp.]
MLSAAGGEEALKIVLEKHVDLIILDVQMPGMDGIEVAQILKSNIRTKKYPYHFCYCGKQRAQTDDKRI